jgi:hypothetical protein
VPVKRALVLVIAALLLGETACASRQPPEGAVATPEAFVLADCPVRNANFCKVAVQVANAIVSRDAETIIRNSRSDRFDCDSWVAATHPGLSDTRRPGRPSRP